MKINLEPHHPAGAEAVEETHEPAPPTTCFDCPSHEHDTVNPPEGWGSRTLKPRGCYGLRPACSEIQPQDGKGSLDG